MSSRLLVAALLVSAPPLAAQDPGYQIRPGDRVTIQLVTAAGQEVSVVDGERIVDRNGEIFLPFVETIEVAGLDETSLRSLLRREYAAFYSDPVVDVRVELRVSVTGAVLRPGQYFLDPTATVVDAVAQAGGTSSEFAVANIQIPSNPEEVRIVRATGETLVVNLRPTEIEPEVASLPIQSGDWIYVPFQDRSRIRDEITFWGSVVSFASSAVALIVLIARN